MTTNVNNIYNFKYGATQPYLLLTPQKASPQKARIDVASFWD
jgi:hypothetical protein